MLPVELNVFGGYVNNGDAVVITIVVGFIVVEVVVGATVVEVVDNVL